jgi:hypothetical protein
MFTVSTQHENVTGFIRLILSYYFIDFDLEGRMCGISALKFTDQVGLVVTL